MLPLLAYSLAAGLTVSGVAACLLELATGRRLGFRPPFLVRERLLVSLFRAAAAGPYMVGNEALAAFREGVIGPLHLAAWTAIATAWALATGILVIEVALAALSVIS